MKVKTVHFFYLVGIFAYCSISVGNAEPATVNDGSNVTAISEKKPAESASFLPDELSWKNGVGQALTLGGLAVSSFLLLGGLTWLLAPLLGFRMCTIFNNCETSSASGASSGQDGTNGGSAYADLYPYTVSQYPAGLFRKRSLNYIGPILKTLASAYDKYEHATTPKTE